VTVQNGTQWNRDGEKRRDKPLPHLALDTLDEVSEKVCEGLKRASRLIKSGGVLCPPSRISGWPMRTQVGIRH